MQTISDENILIVSVIEPKLKHPTIFARFDELEEGTSLTIHNDHDPKPLYYQLLGERGNVFTWEYLEEGPTLWRVRIGKRRSDENDESLGEIAANDLRKAEVFKKYGLDFSCGGKQTVKEACADKGLDVAKIEQELQQVEHNFSARQLAYNEWSLEFLSDFILNVHYNYYRKNMPEIVQYARKVTEVHQNEHPELIRINDLIEVINAEINSHILKMEKIVFPYIKEIEKSYKHKSALINNSFDSIQTPINMMLMEHESIGENLKEISNLSNKFTIPQDACASYTLLYNMLKELEDDIILHTHLENNILFPKVIELEKSIKN